MNTPKDSGNASETVVVSARTHPAFKKRLEAVQLERGDRWLAHTVEALLREGVDRHERQRAA